MTIRKYSVPVTTGSGTATAYSPWLSGYIESIQYVKDTFDDGVDFTITADVTGETIWTQSNVNSAVIKHPRAATVDATGVASLYASGGTAVNDRIALGRDRVKIAIAQGGTAKSGTFVITVDDAK